MGALGMRLRSEMRSRLRATIGLALLVGLAGGIVLASVAGARRTSSSYTRLIEKNEIADLLVNPDQGTDSKLKPADFARLPSVAEAADINGVLFATLTPQRYPDLENGPIVLAPSDDSFARSFNRFRVFSGAVYDRSDPNQVVVDVGYANFAHIKPGDTLTLYWPTDLEHIALSPQQGPPPSMKAFRFHVAGIVVDPYTVTVDEGFATGYVFLTPAFWTQHPETAAGYWGEAVKLRRGAAGLPAFRRDLTRIVPDESIALQTLPVTRDKTQRAIRPHADALTFFALAVAFAGLLLVGQALSRQLFVESGDNPVLSAVGFSRGQLFGLGIVRAAMIGAAGAAIAVVIAAAASGLFPIGPGRLAEPTPGPSLDVPVLALGGVAVFLAVLGLAIVPAIRAAHARAEAREAGPGVSRVAEALTRSGASAPATVGVRLAVEPGRGRTSVPVRTTIGAAAIGIAAVLAALTFGAGLSHLAATPRLYGWNWSTMIEPGGEDPATAESVASKIDEVLALSPLVAGWSKASLSEARLNDLAVVTVGIDPLRGKVFPSVALGRAPRNDSEVALGSVTMRKLGVAVGDTVTARATDGTSQRLKVVGRVVLPGLGNYPGSDKTALGEGAVMTRATALRLGPAFNVRILVRFRAGVTESRGAAALEPAIAAVATDPSGEAPVVTQVQKPSDVKNYEHVRATPIGLAGVLGALAIAAVAHVLGAAVRRRSRDLAVLKTMGMVRRQVRATVAWQASVVALAALAIGIPIGVAVGRLAWSAFATQLGTVAEPRVPLITVLLAVPAVLLACNVVASLPARRAARTPAALVLRSE
jgi:ABC-type lipoprotein release transport system permease subunit